MLGEFECPILSAAVRLEDNAYGAAIRQQIEATTKRRCSVRALLHWEGAAPRGSIALAGALVKD